MKLMSSVRRHQHTIFLAILSAIVVYILFLQFRILRELRSLRYDVSSIDAETSGMKDTVENIDYQVSGLNP